MHLNLKAQFSSQLNSDGTLKTYQIVSGSTITECFNEQLDSADIILDHVSSTDRLKHIKPYDYVRIFDDTPDVINPFDRVFLVSSYNEQMLNVPSSYEGQESLYKYVINLMSETKLLEKIQLPNLTITHRLNETANVAKQTIYDYISHYMELYVPKIKMYNSTTEKWEYKPIIECPDNNSLFAQKFNVTCADMSLASYTLRTALTALMQQVSCIPVVKNHVLGFLDFKGAQENFTIDNTNKNEFNYISRSLASDSYVNTLVNMSSNVLDSGNEVISESLGFRNSSNAIIKQNSDFHLETKFPIYKINEVKVRVPFELNGYIVSGNQDNRNLFPYFYVQSNTSSGIVHYNIEVYRSPTAGPFVQSRATTATSDIYFHAGKITVTKTESLSSPTGKIKSFTKIEENENYKKLIYQAGTEFANDGETDYPWELDVEISTDEGINIFWIEGEIQEEPILGIYYTDVDFTIDSYVPIASTTRHDGIQNQALVFNYVNQKTEDDLGITSSLFGLSDPVDITNLVKENSERSLLNTNFVEASQAETLEEMEEYYYGTVGYSIGSNIISGFSEMYSVGEKTIIGFLNLQYTIIEKISRIIRENITPSEAFANLENNLTNLPFTIRYPDNFYDARIGETTLNVEDVYVDVVDDEFSIANLTIGMLERVDNVLTNRQNYIFPLFVFDVKYQPMNSFNLKFTKNEDIPYNISQYDGAAGGVTDFDRLSIHEQEQVDRFGQETLNINQRTSDYSHIKPLNSLFEDEYTIFQRVIAIDNYNYNVSYTGSKNAILKDYFTSIRTKYRAYQYVDYSQSVLRKENDTFYVRIGEGTNDYYNGSNLSSSLIAQKTIDGIIENDDKEYEDKLKYVLIKGKNKANTKNQTTINEISVITNNNTLGVVYEQKDNVGEGCYYSDIFLDKKTGGFIQDWQIWEKDYDDFATKHDVTFVSNLNVYSNYPADISTESSKLLYKLPIIATNENVFDIFPDAKKVIDLQNRYFYKDLSERINHTVQFNYYTDSPNINWTELMFKNSTAVQNSDYEPTGFICYRDIRDEAILSKEEHTEDLGSVSYFGINNIKNYVSIVTNDGVTKIVVNWDAIYDLEPQSDFEKFKIVCKTENNLFVDFVLFTKGSTPVQYFPITLNDTRSDYVYTYTNNVLHKCKKVATGTLDRSVSNL